MTQETAKQYARSLKWTERLHYTALEFTHALIEASKVPFLRFGETVADLGKYLPIFAILGILIGIHHGWQAGLTVGIVGYVAAVAWNFYKGNIGT